VPRLDSTDAQTCDAHRRGRQLLPFGGDPARRRERDERRLGEELVKRLVLLLAVVLQSGIAGCAKDTAMIDGGSGEFHFVSSEQCMYSSAFGPPPLLQPLGPTYLESTTLQGMLRLGTSSTGTAEGRSSSTISLPSGDIVQQAAVRCAVTYRQADVGKFEMEQKCEATPLRGRLSMAAQVFTYGPIRIRGYRSHSDLLGADTQLEIETVTTFNGANTPRLCHRTWSAVSVNQDR